MITDAIKNALSGKDNIEAVILFGSFARGEEDKRSDVDLCVVLKKTGKTERDEISDIALNLQKTIDRDIQLVFTDKSFSGQERYFMESILREGIVLVGQLPPISVQQLQLEPFVIFKYDLSKLSQTEKMTITRELYGKTTKKEYKGKEYISEKAGIAKKIGAERTGIASLMVPQKYAREVENALVAHKAKIRKIAIWVSRM